MQKLKKRGGFTLVELIVVLVILAILAALLIPALTGYIDKSKRDQVVAETRMLHEAVQTVASEAYGSAEWPSGDIFTIANQSGRNVTNPKDTKTHDNLKDRYNEIVKLAEVPSLTDGTGDFAAFTDTKGSVFCTTPGAACLARISGRPANTRSMMNRRISTTIPLGTETISTL